MKRISKTLLAISSSLFFFMSPITLFADAEVIVTVKNEDIGNNLDLEAIVTLFNKSDDLADFEENINDSEIQISNIDYNHDGDLDYIRPIEAIEKHKQVIILQSVLGNDLYYDIAKIEILVSRSEENIAFDKTSLVETADSNNTPENNISIRKAVNSEENATEKTAMHTDMNASIKK